MELFTVIVTVYTDYTVTAPGEIEVHGTVDDTPEEGFVLGVFSTEEKAITSWVEFRNAQVVEEDTDDLTKCPLSSATFYVNKLDGIDPCTEGRPLGLVDD